MISTSKHPTVLSSRFSAALLSLSLLLAAGWQTEAAPRRSNINIIPTVTGLTLNNGQLLASGNATVVIKGQTNVVPFSGVPVNLSLAPDQTGAGTCPILDLQLAPITLNVLGLVVQTSPICLNITAVEGGGLLGDLLCSVANLLNGGLNLNQILSGVGTATLPGLTGGQISTLLSGIQTLLNGALGNLAQAVLTSAVAGTAQHECAILHLELGPLNLNLLGLQVDLDNCASGPVVVDITGRTGRGNLLGNLLCELFEGGALDLGATLQQLLNQLLGLLTQ